MSDDARAAVDAEAPVNPYSLLEALNRSSRAAGTAWLIFLGLMAYLLVTVAGVTHRDLLLNEGVLLPVLQVRIDLARFFRFAPLALLLLHAGLIGQLVLLARKALEFDTALHLLESTDRPTHPLRLELDNFFLVQAIAGPQRSRMVSAFLHAVTWSTLVVLPLLLLLWVQLVFLPFHDPVTTAIDRAALLADVGMLAGLGVFLVHLETSYFRACWRMAAHNPGSTAFGAVVLGAAALFSVLLATVPDGGDDRSAMFAAADGALFGLFPRNLSLEGVDVAAGRLAAPGRPSLVLRRRDLRGARLARAGLQHVDLSGANLDGADLAGADLRGARLECGDAGLLRRAGDRGAARCASARGASFVAARLSEAMMAGLDLGGARLDDARLEGADLSGGAMLQGATFQRANLQGADLSGAGLQLTDFSGASMQGADLSLAVLDGALLRNADLEGANLHRARLYGADLSGAKVKASDMTRARLWRTVPPGGDAALMADLTQIVLKAPSGNEVGGIAATVASLGNASLEARLGRMGPLAGDDGSWVSSQEGQAWSALMRASEAAARQDDYKARLSIHLARLACRAGLRDGAVAAGVARRAVSGGFKGDVGYIHERLRSGECAAATAVPPPLLAALAAAAEAARGP
jgi:uncharacterized protein YjbI with pentapeptide repeats